MSPKPVVGTDNYETLVDALVRRDLPGLPADRRDTTVGFASGRFQTMASPVRIGLQTVVMMLAVPLRILGADRIVAWLGDTRIPVVSDVPRAMRFLTVSYVWETWPDTAPDGTPGPGHPSELADPTRQGSYAR